MDGYRHNAVIDVLTKLFVFGILCFYVLPIYVVDDFKLFIGLVHALDFALKIPVLVHKP